MVEKRNDGTARGPIIVRKNINRGYMQLHVWQDALEYYRGTCPVFRPFPYELKRVASQQITSVDSIHRNIAEGYGRRSLKEYLQFLNIAMASAAESVSGLHACYAAGQIDEPAFDALDSLAFKIENGMKKADRIPPAETARRHVGRPIHRPRIQRLLRFRFLPGFQHSMISTPHHSTIPPLPHHSSIPLFQHSNKGPPP